MFDTIILDFDVYDLDSNHTASQEDFDTREFRLMPFIYLIAERIIEARRDYEGARKYEFVESIRCVRDGRPNVMDAAFNNEGSYFSPLKSRKASVLRRQGITIQNAILLLAAAGLEITIPKFTFDVARTEEVSILRAKLEDERYDYLEAITHMADETYHRVISGYYKDTVDWALNEAFVKIKPKLIAFERAMAKLEKNFLKRLSLNFIQEGIPSISSVVVTKGIKAGVITSVEEVLKMMSKNLARDIEERKVPEVVYGYKFNKALFE